MTRIALMFDSFPPGAGGAQTRPRAPPRQRGAAAVEPSDLLAALADEAESRAAVLLAEFGLGRTAVWAALGVAEPITFDAAAGAPALPHSHDYRATLADAEAQARSVDRARAVGTEHLLAALIAPAGPLTERLADAGLALDALRARVGENVGGEAAPLTLPGEVPPLELADPGHEVDVGRMLDASANRAREGLRVVEDYVRFVMDDPGLTRRVKQVRHRLAEAVRGLDLDLLIGARDTPGDVGTHIMTASEQARESPRAVLTANFKRTGEALRSLEEYCKLADVWLAGRFEVLRYDLYTLEKLVLTAVTAYRSLRDARLMVLVGGLPTLGDLTWIVGEALAGGADVIQLREKGLPDRELLHRAREVRILTAQARARFVLNDRPDLARLAGADGVHLGQDDLTLRDARRVVGPSALVGLSTHDRAQLDQAVVAGASYLGVGPVFPSATKDFSDLAGLAFVRFAAETTALPWFAIGGITPETVGRVLEAGATRVAVSAAVMRAESPREATAALRETLRA
jgi:thiamine-phosphate pyrophosphorylase